MKARLAIVAVAATLLIAMVVVGTQLGGTDSEGSVEDPCLRAWNSDPVARQDGVHAYKVHRYRATLVTRVDADANLLEPDSTQGRCAVVFASPRPDQELDFGVRVYERGRWAGLGLVDGLTIDEIGDLQREAMSRVNATLHPDGTLVRN
ncbi:MAG TPA: hypothetical protein VIL04_10790 [Solirubrobacterales bacterium]